VAVILVAVAVAVRHMEQAVEVVTEMVLQVIQGQPDCPEPTVVAEVELLTNISLAIHVVLVERV
jgi:hypothetical protein